MKKENRGGSRPNSGRKKGIPKKLLNLRVPSYLLKRLSEKYSVSERNKKIVDFLKTLV